MKTDVTSRISGFYKLRPAERRAMIEGLRVLSDRSIAHLAAGGGLSIDVADCMSENVIATHGLPLGVALNFRVNQRDVLVGGLPYGVRKIVELGRALASEPRLLLLDEPSSGLNVEETNDMVFWIKDIRDDLDVTVLMIEHDMSLVSAVSDRVLAMSSGRMLALGPPAEVQRDPAVAAAYLGG